VCADAQILRLEPDDLRSASSADFGWSSRFERAMGALVLRGDVACRGGRRPGHAERRARVHAFQPYDLGAGPGVPARARERRTEQA
jgi:hypothetical protein